MRRIPYLATTFILFALLCSFSSGCKSFALTDPGSTPLQRSLSAEETYTAVLRSLNTLDTQGLIPESAKPSIYLAQQQAKLNLELMKSAALRGESVTFNTAVSNFNQAIDELIRRRAASLRRPTTLPAP